MEREHVADAKESGNGPMRPLVWADANGGWAVRRIIPPPDNDRDAAAVEQLLGSLHGTPGPLSLEIAGDARQRQMLVRGSPSAVGHVVHQLQAAYGQVSWEDPDDDDPALCLLNSGDHADKGHPLDAAHVAHRRLELRRAIFYPIKTWREFDEADPLRVLLGAFRGLEPGELLFSQLVLLRPAPDDWSDAYQGSAQDVDFRMKAASAAGQARAGLFALGIILGSLDLAMLFASVGVFFRPSVGFLDVLKVVGGLGLLAAINAGLAVPTWRAWRALTARLNANPQVVQCKVSLPAFECELRLWAVAPAPERSEALMRRLASAYRLYNLADGNALSPAEGQGPVAPHILPSARSTLGVHHPFEAIRRALGEPQGLVLNLAELAGLWHMPVGEALELVRREGYERYVPLPEDVSGLDGVPVGVSVKDDQISIPVSLSGDAVTRNILLMGKTQMGKSNIMEILAHARMQEKESALRPGSPRLCSGQAGQALVVLDPQGDMVRHLRGLVPPDRVHETYYVDFADRQRCVGLNLLDMTLGLDVDKVVSDLIGLGEALWSKYWGPRMEAVWRYATKTLSLINVRRVAMGLPEQQYTILDVPPLLLAPRNRREPFLLSNLPLDTPDGQDVRWWWSRWYEPLRSSLQQDVISPVLTKVFRLSGNSASRSVFGQAVSTLNLRDVLHQGAILLVHTATGELGEEIGGFMGAVILNLLNVVIRERAAKARARRTPCLVIVDEFQSIPSVNYGALLSELQKFEVAFVLGTQSLARLRAIERELPGIIFASVATLMSFQVNYEDAKYLSGELDGVPPASLVNLEPFHAYVKTTGPDGKRLPVYSMRGNPPLAPDPSVAARVLEQVSGYSRLAAGAQEQTSRLAAELSDSTEARQREEEINTWLQAREESDFVTEQQLGELARMMATRSTQDYGPKAGSIGRGMSARPEQSRRAGRGRKRRIQGFQVLGTGDENDH